MAIVGATVVQRPDPTPPKVPIGDARSAYIKSFMDLGDEELEQTEVKQLLLDILDVFGQSTDLSRAIMRAHGDIDAIGDVEMIESIRFGRSFPVPTKEKPMTPGPFDVTADEMCEADRKLLSD